MVQLLQISDAVGDDIPAFLGAKSWDEDKEIESVTTLIDGEGRVTGIIFHEKED